MTKNKEWIKVILIGVGIILLANIISDSTPQSIAPSCFSKEECKVSVKKGYCEVEYDCVVGACYSHDILCPETCFGGKDEDKDGLTDCSDPDCYKSTECGCWMMGFDVCKKGNCFCQSGTSSHWKIYEDGTNACECI